MWFPCWASRLLPLYKLRYLRMKLEGSQAKKLHEALLSAFATRSELRRMVKFNLNKDLDEIASGDTNADIVLDLISWSEQNGLLFELVKGALNARIHNVELRDVATDLILLFREPEGKEFARLLKNQPEYENKILVLPRKFRVEIIICVNLVVVCGYYFFVLALELIR